MLDGADAPPINGQTQIDFNVRFQPSVKANEAGPVFTTYQVAHEPYPVWSAPTPPNMYTVICWDPDVSDKKSFLHWLVANCSGSDNSEGTVLAKWYPPSPPPTTGQHRYILGLFNQTQPLTIPEITERTNFNATTFAQQNGLTPVAYRGFRVKASDAAPPAEANPNTNGQLPAVV
jgi:phosphatidylethanolamine-binding protein (PEBP) family uncharacterized protein